MRVVTASAAEPGFIPARRNPIQTPLMPSASVVPPGVPPAPPRPAIPPSPPVPPPLPRSVMGHANGCGVRIEEIDDRTRRVGEGPTDVEGPSRRSTRLRPPHAVRRAGDAAGQVAAPLAQAAEVLPPPMAVATPAAPPMAPPPAAAAPAFPPFAHVASPFGSPLTTAFPPAPPRPAGWAALPAPPVPPTPAVARAAPTPVASAVPPAPPAPART